MRQERRSISKEGVVLPYGKKKALSGGEPEGYHHCCTQKWPAHSAWCWYAPATRPMSLADGGLSRNCCTTVVGAGPSSRRSLVDLSMNSTISSLQRRPYTWEDARRKKKKKKGTVSCRYPRFRGVPLSSKRCLLIACTCARVPYAGVFRLSDDFGWVPSGDMALFLLRLP